MKKRILSIITVLALAMALLPAAVVPANAALYRVSSSDEFHRALASAADGDVIQLTGSFVLKNPISNNDSLVIDKAVTIQGGGLMLWYAGILLAADVTFKDITLGLASNVRNAIMANGHILTLENVQRDPTARYIHLFCGGQTGATQGDLAAASQGGHGQILIKGNTNLGLANIYAGSLSTDGAPNVFDKPATVVIEPSVTGQPIEHIYASGALETPTSPDDWFDYENEIAPPTPSAARYPVSGDVTFNLYRSAVKQVDGDTGTPDKYAKVNYDGNNDLNDGLVLTNIGGLNVRSGNLVLANRSGFATDGVPLGVGEAATLGLQNLDSEVYVGDFTGGGSLVLGVDQKLVVAGAVSGTTTVGIGGIFNGHSQTIPTLNAAYIDAAGSAENSFALATPASRPDLKLFREANGAWKVGADETVIIVNDFKLASAVVEADAEKLPLLEFQDVDATGSSLGYVLARIDLTISIGGVDTTWDEDSGDYIDEAGIFLISVTDNGDGTGEALQVSSGDHATPPSGTYVISVTVPEANSGTGKPITRVGTLTVKAAAGQDTPIPVPEANKGLVYNGQAQVGVPLNEAYFLSSGVVSAIDADDYTATVMPAGGFTWEDGTAEAQEIPWRIHRADNPNRPTGLNAVPPTAYGASDGRITGTTADMEYAADEAFTSPQPCVGDEITGLSAGDYYVRMAEIPNYKAGAPVLVAVPQGPRPPLTVHSIAISSTDHKNAYKVGEPLDVAGLTLTVTMSDGSERSVPVFASMVEGFDSSAVGDKNLTITYGGQKVQYTISIAEDDSTDPTAVTGVTLNKSGTTLTAGSSERLTATVSPDTAANKNVTWASQNKAVATVDADGTVAAVNAGTAVITVTTEDGGKTASCTVTVRPKGGGGSTGGGSTGGGSTGGGSTGGGSTGGGSTGGGSTGGGSTGGGSTGGGSTGGGSTGGGSTGGGSTGGSTTTETTRNPDGSTTTKVTNTTTGTVTDTTRHTDGSTTVAETKRDGTVTTTDTTRNGVKAVTVSKPGANTSARITLPDSVRTATVTLPGKAAAGMVAVDAKTGEVIKLSAPTEAGMAVKLDASAELILEDRSKAFTDTEGHWAKNAIDFATAHAFFNGTSDTTFAPNESMTRGMVAVMLYNFEGSPDFTVRNSFTDVPSGAWYTDAIGWITHKGITNGYGNGSFGTSDYVTREQLVTFLYRYANAMGYSTEGGVGLSAFPDGASVSAYASEAMRWAVGSGLIVGTDGGRLTPGSTVTRAQVASILNRFVLNLMK